MSLSDEFARYRDEQAIRNLKYRYCWAIDNNDVEKFAGLFTEDGAISARLLDEEEPYLDRQGRDEIRDIVQRRRVELNRQLGQHRAHNPVIAIDGDDAVGHWYFTAVNLSEEGELEFEFGEYHEDYLRADGEWKIRRCRIELLELEPVLKDRP